MTLEELHKAVNTVRHASDTEDATDAANRIYKAFGELAGRIDDALAVIADENHDPEVAPMPWLVAEVRSRLLGHQQP